MGCVCNTQPRKFQRGSEVAGDSGGARRSGQSICGVCGPNDHSLAAAADGAAGVVTTFLVRSPTPLRSHTLRPPPNRAQCACCTHLADGHGVCLGHHGHNGHQAADLRHELEVGRTQPGRKRKHRHRRGMRSGRMLWRVRWPACVGGGWGGAGRAVVWYAGVVWASHC
eukprot:353449-Chlamydomonas_euryale.AAC.2